MIPVSTLRPGDTFIRDGKPVTLIRVVSIELGFLELIWGPGVDDRAVLAGNAMVEKPAES